MGGLAEADFATEELIIRRCARTGLHAVIALDSTRLGPAAGGCRRWVYDSQASGVIDAQRLAEGMTFKNALAGIPFGGGKSVIFASDKRPPTDAQLATFAEWLNDLNGRYVTAEDVGMGVEQMRAMAATTSYVSGCGRAGIGGDPSPKTAYGVYLGLKTAVQIHMGVQHLYGIKVAIQGLGAVGLSLCHWLTRAGAQLIVADLDETRVRHAMRKYDAVGVAIDEITRVDADVFAPCAMGSVLDERFVEETSVSVIAGAANNQLSHAQIAAELKSRDVLYAPDFVINAGGVVSVAHEYMLNDDQFGTDHDAERWVGERIAGIHDRLMSIIKQSQSSGESTHVVAKNMAQMRLRPDAQAAA